MPYTVKPGDTLWDISRKFQVPIQDLMRQMPESVRQDPRKLMPGMQLNILGAQSPQAESRQPRAQAYHREVPPLPEEGSGRQTPPTGWETFKREAPDEAMKMLAGMPPSMAASGLGRGLSYLYGTAARNKHPLEALGATVQDAYYGTKNYLGNLYNKTSGFMDAVRGHPTAAERRMVDNMFVTPNPVPTAAKAVDDSYAVLNPRQFAVRNRIDQLREGVQPLEPDMSRMSGNVSLGTLEKLYPRPNPAWQGADPAYARHLQQYIDEARGLIKPSSDPISNPFKGVRSTPDEYYDFFIRNLNK